MRPKLSRKQFLQAAVAAIASTALALFQRIFATSKITDSTDSYLPDVREPSFNTPPTSTATSDPNQALTSTLKETSPPTSLPAPSTSAFTPTRLVSPTVTATRTAESGHTLGNGGVRVVHAHSSLATSWDFSTGWYGNYVNQDVVNTMTNEGLKLLTEQSTIEAAWQTLLPGYRPGMGIAIKVNLNNSQSCGESDNVIDALIHPVNALIQGMVAMGVQQQDIWVYDALRALPNRFRNGCLYPNIRFFESSGYGCAETARFVSTDPNAEVDFAHARLTNRRVTDVIINATYLINMPIIKDHGIAGVTLGFKNHFGTMVNVVRAGEDSLHYYINPSDARYDPNYNPMVEIFNNPHIRNKTVLTVGDGLYGGLGNTNVVPNPWTTFDNQSPNSLFFSQDPVAIDCVMMDILDAEPIYHPQRPGAQDYLELAAQAGMGVFERGDPWGSGYTLIDYLKIETSIAVGVSAGWNMVSVPVQATNMQLNALFPGITPPAYYYTGAYQAVQGTDPLVPGTGYWMYFATANTYTISGQPVSSQDIPVNAGWNMIGAFDTTVQVSAITSTPTGILVLPVYKYASGYIQASTLQPGVAYWAYATRAGTLHLGGGGSLAASALQPLSNTRNLPQDFRLPLEVSSGENTNAVVLGVSPQGSAGYDAGLDRLAPPQGPSGTFDVWLANEGERFLQDIRSSQSGKYTFTLLVRPAPEGEDIVLRWDGVALAGLGKFEVVDLTGGELFVLDMSTVEELVIQPGSVLYNGMQIRVIADPPNYPMFLPLLVR